MLIDTHAHLTSGSLESELAAVLDRAAAAGVERIMAIGCDTESSRRSLEIAEQYPQVWATVGLHPTYVTEEPREDWLEEIRRLAQHPKCAGIGEAGLDFYHPAPEGWTWEAYVTRQKDCFQSQLELAAVLGLNIVVHQRDRSGTQCWEEIKSMIAPWQGKLRAVFHCWLHAWTEAQPVIAAGHLISFTGIVTYKNAPAVAACATEAPAGSFMLETDAPYLAPVPHRGRRNEPAFVRDTAAWIASLRGETIDGLGSTTGATAMDFFRWDRRNGVS